MSPGFAQTAALSQDMRQQMRISPQMRQSFEILQMPLQALQARIRQEAERNPVIEVADPMSVSLDAERESFTAQERGGDSALGFDGADGPDESDGYDGPDEPPDTGRAETDDGSESEAAPELESGFRQMAEDPDFTDSLFQDGGSGDVSPDAEERRQFRYDSISRKPSLDEHLLRQLDALDLAPAERALALQIIGSLDRNGFLATPLADIAQSLGAGLAEAEQALARVQALDPPGLAARGLAESLLLQLRAEGLDDTLAADILRSRPDLLEKRNPALLAKTFQCTEADIRVALADLAALNPHPAEGFADDEPQYITPEATVVLRGGMYVVLELVAPDEAPPDGSPVISIRGDYRAMADAPDARPDVRSYLRERIRSAEQLREFVAQRRATTLRVAAEIVARQQEFFRRGVAALRPMTMDDVAEAIGVNETTVSRAVKDRWMRTPRGLVAFRDFFTAGIRTEAGGAVSNRTVQERIRQLVAAEDPSRPLSDDALCAALKTEGFEIARRTVAKYRGILGIPAMAERRRS